MSHTDTTDDLVRITIKPKEPRPLYLRWEDVALAMPINATPQASTEVQNALMQLATDRVVNSHALMDLKAVAAFNNAAHNRSDLEKVAVNAHKAYTRRQSDRALARL